MELESFLSLDYFQLRSHNGPVTGGGGRSPPPPMDPSLELACPGPDLSVWRPWAGSLLEAPTHPQML